MPATATFRDFGISPDQAQPPQGVIRAYFSPSRVFGQYLASALVGAVGIGLAVVVGIFMPIQFGVLAIVATVLMFAQFIWLGTRHDRRWIELEGNTLRAGHLYGGPVLKRSIDQIVRLRTIFFNRQTKEGVVISWLLGRVKGVQVDFRDGRTPLQILRADPAMTDAQPLIEAILYRLSETAELESEQTPQGLIKQVQRKGEKQPAPKPNSLGVVVVCMLVLAWMFGVIFAAMAISQRELRDVATQPAQPMTVAELAAHGPGSNRHLAVSGYRAGGYVYELQNSTWTEVWVALFPREPVAGPRQIRVVLDTTHVKTEPELKQLLSRGQLDVMCDKNPRSSWGTETGPNLVKYNDGAPIVDAWELQELREIPSEAQIVHLEYAAAALLGLVIALAVIRFWLG